MITTTLEKYYRPGQTGERLERPADFRIADYLDAGFRSVRSHSPL